MRLFSVEREVASVPKNRSQVPPGGKCRYQDPDTGVVLQHPYYERLKAMAHQHRVVRGLSIPHDWEAVFDREFCRATPSACLEVPDGKTEKQPGLFELAGRFTAAMARWALSGFPVVGYEVFKQRYRTCAGDEDGTPRCPEFKTFKPFGFAKCGQCGCASVKLYLATEKCPLGKWI